MDYGSTRQRTGQANLLIVQGPNGFGRPLAHGERATSGRWLKVGFRQSTMAMEIHEIQQLTLNSYHS